MNRKISWFDMIGFYIILPIVSLASGLLFHGVYRREGNLWFFMIALLFYVFTWFLLGSSIGIFVSKFRREIEKSIKIALQETWNEMINTMIKAQGGE